MPFEDVRVSVLRMAVDGMLTITLLCALIMKVDLSCEILGTNTIGWILIASNFGLMCLGATFEVFRRSSSSIRHLSEIRGIIYFPHKTLGHTEHIYAGQYRPPIGFDKSSMSCAVKKIHGGNSTGINELTELRHANITRIFSVHSDERQMHVAMELCLGSLPEVMARGMFKMTTMDCRQIVDAVATLHSIEIAHNSISPSNILVSDDFTCKLAACVETRTMFNLSSGTSITAREERHKEWIRQDRAARRGDIANLAGVLFFALVGADRSQSANTSSPDQDEGTDDGTDDDVETSQPSREFVLRKVHEADSLALQVAAGTLNTQSYSHLLSHEAAEMITSMTRESEVNVQFAYDHPTFWTLDTKVSYLGEQVGNLLPPKMRRGDNTADSRVAQFVQQLEEACDREIGTYDELNPGDGGQWARKLDSRYPIGGWGTERNAQQSADRIEYLYHAFGGNASTKGERDRKERLAKGTAPSPLAIRTVGLLKFIRNVAYAHRNQHVALGRFASEEQLICWLLDAFPWLVMACWKIDQAIPGWRDDVAQS
jgi:hypothetical protein